jgi:hypothetical protein
MFYDLMIDNVFMDIVKCRNDENTYREQGVRVSSSTSGVVVRILYLIIEENDRRGN